MTHRYTYPGLPWQPLADRGIGYLSVYFSERMARFPVRDITRRADNKSDPNIETGTYGLFSTCEVLMRNKIVKDGAATIFFMTTPRPKSGRFLTGYYHVAWHTEGTQGAVNRDFALAADQIRFIEPIPATALPGELAAVASEPYRQYRRLDQQEVHNFRTVCDLAEDKTDEYLAEVTRVERFAAAQTGYTYPSWGRKTGFNWSDAAEYYFDSTRPTAVKVPNSVKSKRWTCQNCDGIVKSAALLKKCPACQASASLVPEDVR